MIFCSVKISSSVLSLNNDLYICLCYVVPDESSRQALIETNIFDRILEAVVYIESKAQNEFSMLIFGDFNARSSNNPDFVLDDDSHHEPLFTRYRVCLIITGCYC